MRHRQDTDPDGPEKRERTEASEASEASGEEEDGRKTGRRIDLSVAQVSSSALAAVIAAKLASTLGVYGTIVGAGVISVIATCGGPLFQHLFRRTGEQVRDVTTAARPKSRQVPVPAAPRDDRTLTPVAVHDPAPGGSEEFGAATTHGTRARRWKRPAVAAALVFGVTMGGITTYELVSGQDFSGTKGTTTFGSVVRGGESAGKDTPAPDDTDTDPAPAPSGATDGPGTPTTGGTPTPGDGGGTGTGEGTATPSPEPTPSGSTGVPTPTPTGPTTGPTTDPAAPPTPSGEPATGARPETPRAPAPAGGGTGSGAESGTPPG
ncbi:hypothetical protein ACIQHY_33785 [Streptomyces sp. NPDC092359]|uniref:hypothetical protein n=1 Tax=Streptomyces sp. NPDC092359 TaxID=3366014 RepID=UPI00382BD2D7